MANVHHMNSQWKNPEYVNIGELMEFIKIMDDNPNKADPTPMENWCKSNGYHPRQFAAFFQEYSRVYNKMSQEERDAHWRKVLNLQVSKERKEYYESIGIKMLDSTELPGWSG